MPLFVMDLIQNYNYANHLFDANLDDSLSDKLVLFPSSGAALIQDKLEVADYFCSGLQRHVCWLKSHSELRAIYTLHT